MKGSFNYYGFHKAALPLNGTPIWAGFVQAVPLGGTFASDYVRDGVLYPAGTPVSLSDGTITPLIFVKVTAVDTDGGTITVDTGEYGVIPETSDYLRAVADSFDSVDAAGTAISAVSYESKNSYTLTTDLASSVAEGDYLILTPDSDSIATPTGYLRNDAYVTPNGDSAALSGGVVSHCGEGIMIDRTPAAAVATAMAAAVPNVIQVNG